MTDTQEKVENPMDDMFAMATESVGKATELWSSLFGTTVSPVKKESPVTDIFGDFGDSCRKLSEAVMANPEKLFSDQMDMMKKQQELFQRTALRFMGQDTESVVNPARGDKRFKDSDWQENPFFDFVKQMYLIQSNSIMNMIADADGIDEHTRVKATYAIRQMVNAASPSNYPGLNPEVIKKALATGGESLKVGMEQLNEDLSQSVEGALNVAMTDSNAFKVGDNVATTEGKIVYQNDLLQLIQYSPSTDTVFKRPLLVTPPLINKYYIMDLRENNSLLKWYVDQGHTVFVISWVNPGRQMRNVQYEDYIVDGMVKVVDVISEITGEKEMNAVGYCMGGTILATTMAYLKKKRRDVIKSATYFATLVDFSEPGEIGIFVNETAISALEKQMNALGYFDGRQLSFSFNTLRENDLFWSFYINNYLKGERPAAFDLLYWNTDSTNLPAATHSYYLRNMYLHNRLAEKNGIEIRGTKIDLTSVTTPIYFLAAKQDHIAMWKSCYKGTQVFSGKNNRFVLAESGHIAGVINPPSANKYNYWVNDTSDFPAEPDEWYANTTAHDGSWWGNWQEWVTQQNDEKVAARIPGSEKAYPALEEAPGSFVRRRIVDVVADDTF